MAILKIARMGHPVLLRPAAAVTDPTAPEPRQLVADMIDTLEDAGGLGLAAPQVHVSQRVVIFFIPDSRVSSDEGDQAEELTVMFNPEIEPLTDELEVDWEACLSVPGMMGAVPRFKHIRYRWTELDGTESSREATGFHARAVQHECDHLDGILYPMRMTDMRFFGYAEETNRNQPLLRAGRPAQAEEEMEPE